MSIRQLVRDNLLIDNPLISVTYMQIQIHSITNRASFSVDENFSVVVAEMAWQVQETFYMWRFVKAKP